MAKAFLQCHHRFKNGKDHCYWSIAEKVRTHRGWVQRHLLYLGEINDSQKVAWTKVIDVFDTSRQQTCELALYPADRQVPDHAAEYGVQVRLSEFELRRPRQWGACWVGCHLWDQLQLDEFWRERVTNDGERLKFVLASYNCGAGHVRDAQRLTEKYGGSSQSWEDVSYWLLQESTQEYSTDPVVKFGFCRGLEPVNYVSHILERFDRYKQFLVRRRASQSISQIEKLERRYPICISGGTSGFINDDPPSA